MWEEIARNPLSDTTSDPITDIEEFFAKTAPFSTAAYEKTLLFRHGGGQRYDRVWALRDDAAGSVVIRGVLAYCGETAYPIFSAGVAEPPPSFLAVLGVSSRLYGICGGAESVAVLERGLAQIGLSAAERVEYDLMADGGMPPDAAFTAGPAGLVLRPPSESDIERIIPLQAGYEREELASARRKFDPILCRVLTERLIRRARILIACHNGDIIGKINVNAKTPAWSQIGGVYVLPAYRGQGVASRMAAVFTRGLLDAGRRAGLFVKKNNSAARRVYEKTGFTRVGDYRISYF